MARRDLTNHEIEQMGRENPGSAAEYLRLRREEIEAEKEAEREAEDEQRFIEQFVENGGSRTAAKESYQRLRNAAAEQAAVEAAEVALAQTRRHIGSCL